MEFDQFFSRIKSEAVEVDFRGVSHLPLAVPRLSNEAMFHLPLIAITILMLSKGQSKPVVSEVGQLVGDCYERTFPGFRGSAQHLGWSSALRVRTVQALAFLEQSGLVDVERIHKKISATCAGRDVLSRALDANGDLASNLMAVERRYRDIRAERQLRLSPR